MPTYPPAHRRVQFQGTLLQPQNGGSEIFDFGWADTSGETLAAIATQYLASMQTGWTTPQCSVSSLARLVGVRVENVQADGKVDGSYYVAGTGPVGAAGGANITILSNCLTLETSTGTGKGRNVRGRFYPPAYASVAGATSALSDIQAYVGAWASVLHDAVSNGLQPAVASVTAGGQVVPVTALSAGTVIDTIRRRKNHVTVQRSSKVSILTS